MSIYLSFIVRFCRMLFTGLIRVLRISLDVLKSMKSLDTHVLKAMLDITVLPTYRQDFKL